MGQLCSARRPKKRPPCEAATVGLFERFSRDGVLIGLGVGAGKMLGAKRNVKTTVH